MHTIGTVDAYIYRQNGVQETGGENMLNKKSLYHSLNELVKVPSISGTVDEVKAACRIEELLREIPYFATHEDHVIRVPIEGDPFGRFLVAAFLEAPQKCEDTVILTGHYDVVDVEEFGSLRDIAFDMERVSERICELPLSEEARMDQESGEYLFGRGVFDMKFGHALSIELLRHYAQERTLKGNLLYVAVCGEETNSEGMLAAVPFFYDFAKAGNLRYRCLLLMEGFMVDDQEEGVRYIQYNNAGKVMPMFFCIGKTTHGEEPLLGLDANLMSSEVYRLMHANPEFCQKNHGITTAVPCGLKTQDLTENYSLSTTLYAASYYNIASISLDPEDLIEKLKGVAQRAFDNVVKLTEENVRRFSEIAGRNTEYYQPVPCIQTYAEFYREIEESYEGDLKELVRNKLAEYMAEDPEMQGCCVKLMKYLAGISTNKTPRIIISIIPPYYPDVNMNLEEEDAAAMMDCIDDVIQYASDQYGETLKTSEYYGISDMCYTWLADGLEFDELFKNLVGIGSVYQFPTEALKNFRVPGMVLGSAGKDMHKYTERLEKHYNFDVLPELFIHVINRLIG